MIKAKKLAVSLAFVLYLYLALNSLLMIPGVTSARVPPKPHMSDRCFVFSEWVLTTGFIKEDLDIGGDVFFYYFFSPLDVFFPKADGASDLFPLQTLVVGLVPLVLLVVQYNKRIFSVNFLKDVARVMSVFLFYWFVIAIWSREFRILDFSPSRPAIVFIVFSLIVLTALLLKWCYTRWKNDVKYLLLISPFFIAVFIGVLRIFWTAVKIFADYPPL